MPGLAQRRPLFLRKSRHFTDIDGSGVPDTEAEFTMRYMMLINHNEVALAKAPPWLWRDYTAGKVN